MKFLLASTSPRRLSLLKEIIRDFEVASPHFDESSVKICKPKMLVKKLAYGKASAVFNKSVGDWCVIGADTVVSFENKIYGKPKNLDEAKKMIKTFSGKKHSVFTGVCILIRQGEIETKIEFQDKTDLYFNNLTDKEIEDYVVNNNVLDKAGGYAIQEGAGKFIKKIVGNYHNIVGLPLAPLYEVLKKENLF